MNNPSPLLWIGKGPDQKNGRINQLREKDWSDLKALGCKEKEKKGRDVLVGFSLRDLAIFNKAEEILLKKMVFVFKLASTEHVPSIIQIKWIWFYFIKSKRYILVCEWGRFQKVEGVNSLFLSCSTPKKTVRPFWPWGKT